MSEAGGRPGTLAARRGTLDLRVGVGRAVVPPPGTAPGGKGSRGADTVWRGRPRGGPIPRRGTRWLGSHGRPYLSAGPGHGRWLGMPDGECWQQSWQPPGPQRARSRGGGGGGRGLTAPGPASKPRAPPPPWPRGWPRLLRPPPGSSSVHRRGGRGRSISIGPRDVRPAHSPPSPWREERMRSGPEAGAVMPSAVVPVRGLRYPSIFPYSGGLGAPGTRRSKSRTQDFVMSGLHSPVNESAGGKPP